MNNQNEESGPSGRRDEADFDTKPVIVAIGASAGGVQALQTFIGALPEKSGAAFVVVVHLDPEKRSIILGDVVLGFTPKAPGDPAELLVFKPHRRTAYDQRTVWRDCH